MSTALDNWKKVHEIFDPMVPAPAELRIPRTRYNPLSEKIAPRLKLPLEHQKYVLAGGIGSGKSTELRATAAELADGQLVVLVDLWRHFESTVTDPGALNHLQPAELVGLLGLAIYRTAKEVLGHDWKQVGERFEAALRGIQTPSDAEGSPTLDVARLAKGMAVVVGGAAGALLAGPGGALAGVGVTQVGIEAGLKVLDAVDDATAWEWKVGLRGRQRSSDQDAPVRAIIQATNALLDDIRRHYHRRIVLLVDGLDRVQDLETFEDLFVESSLISELRCHLVATLQLGLVQQYRTRLQLWCRPFDFTYVPVASKDRPDKQHTDGINFFLSLAAQRFNTLGITSPISEAQLQRLAYYSGGRLREFISLIREVSIQAMLDDAASTTDEHISGALRDLRLDRESGLNTDEIQILQAVLEDVPDHQLPADPVALSLIERQLLLAYPNESTWYLPHTILMLNLLDPIGATASG